MNKRQQVLSWYRLGLIEEKNIHEALNLSQAKVSPQQWIDLISKNLILFGFISLSVGIIFFLAYNWVDMSNFTKFVLVQSLLGLSAILFTLVKSYSHLSTALLFFIALLVGALFALFGQTYQTGKDPWQLFMLWCTVITPLATISKNSSLWMLWLALLNLSIYLFLDSHSWIVGFYFNNHIDVAFIALINAFAGLLFYVVLKNKSSDKHSLAFYIAMLLAFAAFIWLSFYVVFAKVFPFRCLFLYLAWMTLSYYFFKVKSVNTLLMSYWCLSAISFGMFLLVWIMADFFNSLTLLFLSIALIMMTTYATRWLMKLHKIESGEYHE